MKKQKPHQDAVTVLRETAKGMGKLKLHPHAEYTEGLEKRTN